MSYYYQIGGDISNEGKASDPGKWRTADFGRISKNQCINVRQTGNNKPGTRSMDRDDNEAMFVPQGYAVLGYDHDNCVSSGRGVQFYHGHHVSRAANQDAVDRVKAITGNKPGGIYNFKGPNGGRDEDQPRNIAKKMSSWRVFDVNTSDGLENLIRSIDDVESDAGGLVSSNARSYKRQICEHVDKNTFDKTAFPDEDSRRYQFTSNCEKFLSRGEIDRIWPGAAPEEDSDSDYVPEVDSPADQMDEFDWDSDPDPEEEEGTDWLLYGGIAAAVSVLLMIIIAVVMMSKKKKI